MIRMPSAIDNVGVATTSAPVSITVYPAPVLPTIRVPPQNQAVQDGSNATFTVSATGTALLHYQWIFNDTNAVGINSNALRLTNVSFDNAGPYSVIVSNLVGSVTSAPAILTVRAIDDRLVQMGSATATPGSSVTIPV